MLSPLISEEKGKREEKSEGGKGNPSSITLKQSRVGERRGNRFFLAFSLEKKRVLQLRFAASLGKRTR